jgi:hypothetical protein
MHNNSNNNNKRVQQHLDKNQELLQVDHLQKVNQDKKMARARRMIKKMLLLQR